MMHLIRCQDQVIHPNQFKGLKGYIIKALNWVRWRLEVRVQHLVISYLAREGSLPGIRKGEVLRSFFIEDSINKIDYVEPNSKLYNLENRSFTKALNEVTEENKKWVRPKPIDNLVGAYMHPKTARYYKSRNSLRVEDDAFDIVKGG